MDKEKLKAKARLNYLYEVEDDFAKTLHWLQINASQAFNSGFDAGWNARTTDAGNTWVRIEKLADLPEADGDYWVMQSHPDGFAYPGVESFENGQWVCVDERYPILAWMPIPDFATDSPERATRKQT